MKPQRAAGHASPATLRHFSASIPMMLLRAREAVMQRFRGMLRDNDLTEQQWRVLRALSTVSAIEISGLARSTFLLAPSLSRILPELAGRRLVSVKQDERDQRKKLIRLTSRGARLIETIAPLSEQIYSEITETFGSERLAQLQTLLLELEADLQTNGSDGEAEASRTAATPKAPGRHRGRRSAR